MSKSRAALAPAVVAAAVALTGCSLGSSSSTESATESVKSATEQAKSSTEGSSSETSASSETSQESSESSSESSSSSSESETSSSSRNTPTVADLERYAESHETRACKIRDFSSIPRTMGASFCTSDTSDIKPDYKGQTLYVVTATKYKKGHSYSYTVTSGSRSQTNKYDSQLVGATDGEPLSLAVKLPMDGSGTATISFKDNNSEFAKKTIKVSSPA